MTASRSSEGDKRPDFQGWLAGVKAQAASRGHRALVLLEGDAGWGRERAVDATSTLGNQTLWIGDSPPDLPPQMESVPPGKARRWLGREIDDLIWDGHDSLRPDAMGALCGTIMAGGVWLWLVPPLEDWQAREDSPFVRRMARLLGDDQRVWRVRQGKSWPSSPSSPAEASALHTSGPTADQQKAVSAIEKVCHGHRKRPLVMTADRGRGKTAALGIAAGRIAAQGGVKLVVTAPARSALDSLWRHAPESWPGVVTQPNALYDDQSRLDFMPPDRILEERPEADLLLVDEAAAIPAPLLEQFLQCYPRVVFSSTIHGYEGTGRGFAVRFRESLDALTPQWRALHLEEPIRWSEGDALEAVMNDLLLMDAEADAPPAEGPFTVHHWPRDERGDDEGTLRAVFGLLVNAHYQTSPDDLRQLLDDPASELWLARAETGAVVGALWLLCEGPLSGSMAEAVWRGERRVPGELLPQALTFQGGAPEAGALRYGRVVRVAVAPEWRRRGIGSVLMGEVVKSAEDWALDVVGTSFGATAELLPFWRATGFDSLRLGLKRDGASGAYAIIMARGVSEEGRALCQRQRRRFAQHWAWLRAQELKHLEVDLVWLLESEWGWNEGLDPDDMRELRAFVDGHRGVAVTTVPLQRLTGVAQRDSLPDDRLTASDRQLWVRRVLQGWSWDELRHTGLVEGRRQGEQRLRELAGRLYQFGGV